MIIELKHLNLNLTFIFIKVSVLVLNNVGLTVAGLLIFLCPLILVSYELLVLFSVILGLAACK
jgi:hypothetical protein